jgi:spore coat polysaccharide biosynthesis protein SpsF (cytidylyltransferase family)
VSARQGRIGVVVQARRGSTRLPGKVLEPLAGRSVLAHVIERCLAIGADVVCCAIPAGTGDDAVDAEAKRAGALTFRGSEADVLDRYYQAAIALGLDVIIRVTADCPLIDPVVCRAVLSLYHRAGADYACNNQPPTWPHGLDCEVFGIEWLSRAWQEAAEPWQREHVTPYIRNHPWARRVNLPMPTPMRPDLRWTLDHPADLLLLRSLFSRVPAGCAQPDYRMVLGIVSAAPHLLGLNAGFDRDEGLKRSMGIALPT